MSVFDRAFFDDSARSQLNQVFGLSSFVESLSYGSEFIALRIHVDSAEDSSKASLDSTEDNVDSFVISTSSNPTDQIIYVSPADVVDLSVRDGGFF